MATSTRVRDRLAESTNLSSSWLDQEVRFLREAGLLATAGRGGGKNAVHHDLRSLGAIMLGMTAARAAEAADAVRLLRGMVFRGQQPPSRVKEALPTFEDQIEDWIKGAGTARLNGAEWDGPSLAVLRSWQANICLNPPSAIVTVDFEDGETTTIVYTGEEGVIPGVRRITTISGDVLLAFGELWADTEIQRNAQRALAALRDSPAKANSGDENADTSPKVPASSTNQSPAKGPEAVSISDTNGGFARGEDSARGGTGHDSEHEPDLFTHAGSARCLMLI